MNTYPNYRKTSFSFLKPAGLSRGDLRGGAFLPEMPAGRCKGAVGNGGATVLFLEGGDGCFFDGINRGGVVRYIRLVEEVSRCCFFDDIVGPGARTRRIGGVRLMVAGFGGFFYDGLLREYGFFAQGFLGTGNGEQGEAEQGCRQAKTMRFHCLKF